MSSVHRGCACAVPLGSGNDCHSARKSVDHLGCHGSASNRREKIDAPCRGDVSTRYGLLPDGNKCSICTQWNFFDCVPPKLPAVCIPHRDVVCEGNPAKLLAALQSKTDCIL